MKTFKIAQLLAVAALLVVGSTYAGCRSCHAKQEVSCCAAKPSCATVRLPIEQVQFNEVITKSCEQPPSVRFEVRKIVTPCSNKDTQEVKCYTTCPKYEGTFDADTGEQIG